jgi:hypothetical protein
MRPATSRLTGNRKLITIYTPNPTVEAAVVHGIDTTLFAKFNISGTCAC